MVLQEIHSWTFEGLIGAFIDLVLAYFLLCGSAFAFFASKLFSFFGLYFPCPCKGSFGYRNNNFCVHKLLFEWPSRKISSIQAMAAERFPFDLVRVKSHSCNGRNEIVDKKKYVRNRLVEFEDEASCSSCSSRHLLSLVDKENGYDAKGKRVINPKRRSRIWRTRRGNFAPISCVTRASLNEANVLGIEDAETSDYLDEKTSRSYGFNESMVDRPGEIKYSSSSEIFVSNVQDNVHIVGNDESRIKMLENALEEEKAAYAALDLELEKERAAAATAADEAIAMILRLQEEKASAEMEMRQYQRMIEERVNYDEEEMNILQDILIKREMENHSLEKELEAYRHFDMRGSDRSNAKRKLLFEDPRQTESTAMPMVTGDEISNIFSSYTVAQTCINTEVGEEPENNTQQKDRAHDNLHSSFYDTEPDDVLDVHVIDENIELREDENENISSSSFSTVSNEPGNIYYDFGDNSPRTSDGPSIRSSMLSASRYKTMPFESGDDSSNAVLTEKLMIDKEIEILGERLRMAKLESEKLKFSAENRESEKGRSKLRRR